MEALLGKRRILEIYLNSVEWGEGVFGAEAAARRYFRVDANVLSASQAAQLAVMLPAPKRFEKRPGSSYIAGRAGDGRRPDGRRRHALSRGGGHRPTSRIAPMAATLSAEIAAAAARLIVEEGMEYGPAKRRAARDFGSARSAELPSNDVVEDEVRAYLALFHADSQPRELAALRAIAAGWMERLAEFRPYLTGAVWRGTATRLNSIHIDLFCDDSKAAELGLIDRRIDYEVSGIDGPAKPFARRPERRSSRAPKLGGTAHLAFTVLDYDDLRGAQRADARGRSPARRPCRAAGTDGRGMKRRALVLGTGAVVAHGGRRRRRPPVQRSWRR